jgi:hypothetical protein
MKAGETDQRLMLKKSQFSASLTKADETLLDFVKE